MGGPHDGERRSVDRAGLHVNFASMSALPVMAAPGKLPSIDATVSYTLYKRMRWGAGENFRVVLVPTWQTPEQTLDLLIDSYGKKL